MHDNRGAKWWVNLDADSHDTVEEMRGKLTVVITFTDLPWRGKDSQEYVVAWERGVEITKALHQAGFPIEVLPDHWDDGDTSIVVDSATVGHTLPDGTRVEVPIDLSHIAQGRKVIDSSEVAGQWSELVDQALERAGFGGAEAHDPAS